MSNDDQQYEQYGQGYGQARGQGYDAQGRPYAADTAPGAPAGAEWPQAHGQDPAGSQGGQGRRPAAYGYPEADAQPYPQTDPQPYPQTGPYAEPVQPQGQAGPGVAQTWEGQTWDTQYQPPIRPLTTPPPAFGYDGSQGSGAPYAGAPQDASRYGARPDTGQQHTGGRPDAPLRQPGYADQRQAGAGQGSYADARQAGAQQAWSRQTGPQQPFHTPPHTGGRQEQPGPHTGQGYGDPQRFGAAQPSAGPGGAGAGSGAYPLPPEAPVRPAASAQPAAAPLVPPAGPVDGVAPAPAAGNDGYGPATTVGNSRITDAQRARAEGRSPIIAPGMQPAAITAALGLLLAGGAALGPYALLVPLVLLQAVTAAGWFRLNGMWPARQGIALAFAGGLVADVVLLAAGRDNGPAALLGTLGVWVLLTLVLQLRSHAGADERMYGLTATVTSAALAVLAGGHLAATGDAVTVGALAVAVAVLVRALPLTGPASVVLALAAATAAGAGAGTLTDFGSRAALLGLAAGGCALIGLRVASYDYPSRFVHMTAGVALPLTAAAPAVYLLGQVLA
ncbi:hypothetical protein STHAL_11400 [Streptomyces halstedii]|uniref:Peptidase C83 domain-containing protein n=1 Tax=Streptomyces halstedii TaxID=1944 RepID=A0ABS6TP96_STRHA|nr:hypothetical protein [Streptomyces halstedii]MBV7670072.1 hypothetical protein [Streptomyces halstedii]